MAAYRRVYDSHHLQSDCQEPGSAPEPYARQSSMGCLYLFGHYNFYYVCMYDQSHHEETRELPGERDNARTNARFTQARKTTHGLDEQHQDVDKTLGGRVSQNDRGQG